MPFALRPALLGLAFLAAGAALHSMPQAGAVQGPPDEAATPPPRTVVIDPGHGGDDRGAIGPAGVEEKQVALALAHRVRALGTSRGLRVLLTRDDDRQVTLMQRAAFANASAGVLVISLHANASPSPTTSGFEIGSYSRTPPAATEAPDERLLVVPLAAGGSRRVALVPWESAQARHADVAAAFAVQTGERLGRVASLGPRGVYRSALRPLAAINVPAVLVDIGYLSNPDEEQLTAGEPRQAAIAQALVDVALAFDPSPVPAERAVPR